MKILLIYPETPATFWSYKYVLKFISKKAVYPPLGLITVAAMLPKNWDIRLIDMNVEKLEDNDIRWADYVFISAMLVQSKSTREVLYRCRRLETKVVAGGPLFNSVPEAYLELTDHLVLNEAELTLPPFLSDLNRGQPNKVYTSDEFPDLSLTPIPRWDLVKLDRYSDVMVQCSRGCPFDCEFCDIKVLNGSKPRIKSTDQIIEELTTLYELGWRGGVFIVDDNFIGNKRKIKKILPYLAAWMKARDYPFTFLTEASINLADDDELIEMVCEAGFDSVFVGLETVNEKSLYECSKTQNCGRDLVASIKKLQAAGLLVLGGYIIGFDNDDESVFSRQIEFIQESGVATAMVGLLSALPKTKLWERLKMENRLELVASGENTDGTINFKPNMDKKNLIDGYRNLVKTIYSPACYYQRVCTFLENYRPRRRRKLSAVDIKAFVKTIFYLGILGNGLSQWYYWKMLFKSFFWHRKSFGSAMTLMIYGHHFRKISEEV
ncbi:MAG: B12-binding domain-containing radical SAM protein [Deltaproteobacteria bacterium]|nr:B12-binding domain-containing radical SAM protein [Deltaproteobacteria bacterium]